MLAEDVPKKSVSFGNFRDVLPRIPCTFYSDRYCILLSFYTFYILFASLLAT